MQVDLHMHTGYSADASIRSPSTINSRLRAADWISSALPIIWIFCVRAARATTVTRKHVRARYGKAPSGRERRY